MGRLDGPARLREVLARPGILVTPGAYDGLTALMVQQAGFEATSVGGAAVSASMLGAPDLGLMSMSELVNQVRNIVDVVDIPVIVDGENGFGGVQNTVRTVHSFERAGVAGIILEDQGANRRCGHFDDKSVIPVDEMVLKLKAAQRTRENPDLMIIARTDALAIEGLEGALARCRAYAEAGADCLFVEAPVTVEQFEEIPRALADLGVPLRANMAEGGKSPLFAAPELEKMGYKIVGYPGGIQKILVKVIAKYLRSLRETGSIEEYFPSEMATLAERSAVLGLDRYYQIEKELVASVEGS